MRVTINRNRNMNAYYPKYLIWTLCLLTLTVRSRGQETTEVQPFPFSLQYYEIAEDREFDPATLDDLRAHGVTNIWIRDCRSDKSRAIVQRFQQEGFRIDFMTHGHEAFIRDEAPRVSVYDPAYESTVRENVRRGLATLREIEAPDYVFPYIDEPFHRKPYLDYSTATRAEFQRRYGYPMPSSFEEAAADARKQLDFLNFQSLIFRDGWLKTGRIVREFDPRVRIAMTHDSHNVYGGGVGSNSQMAIDDVFYWGGDYADLFVYDIYPYLTFDYRYGETGVYRKPRMSQLHYTMAQLRNMTTEYGKKMGFWVGTYNKAWFVRFRGKERAAQYWSEREVLYTAVGGGADYIISPSDYMGHNLPVDRNHWDEYGEGMRILQKEGAWITEAPKVKANACFLFPRTQYLLLQEEYYNVGLSYELFLRAFGELDILHEEQITDDTLKGYRVLVLCDVKLLPERVAQRITRFVEHGGVVIADCVPQLDENRQPSATMRELFGVTEASTDRIRRAGQWVPFVNLASKFSFPPTSGETDSPSVFDAVTEGTVISKIVSPRPCKPVEGVQVACADSGIPWKIDRSVGRGRTTLFGFCLQDTYFHACKTEDDATLNALYAWVRTAFEEAGVQSHVHSSNPDIEAALRSSDKRGYLFLINHESDDPHCEVTLRQLPGRIATLTDVESGEAIARNNGSDTLRIELKVPFGKTKLIRIDYE